MCKAPLQLPNGTEVACHECALCRARAIDDWAGRCTAEAATASASFAVTLTYGRDSVGESLHARAVVHTYSDVQKYIKLLRRHDYDVRYFITGEYGERFGRVHWHLLLFFYGPAPPLAGWSQRGEWLPKASMGQRFNHVRVDDHGAPVMVDDEPAYWWPHGFSFWEPFAYEAARYAAKYIAKGIKGDGVEDASRVVVVPKMSKKPPIGALYFERLAERYVADGLAPQDLFYRFAEVKQRKHDGSVTVKDFMLNNRSAELFLEHYVSAWERAYPGRETPPSELVSNWIEFGVLRLPEGVAQMGEFLDRRRLGVWMDAPRPAKPRGMQLYSWMPGKVEWDKNLGAWVAPGTTAASRMWWVFVKERGQFEWRTIAGRKSAA